MAAGPGLADGGFAAAMAGHAAGVAVVTVAAGERPAGLAVTSLTAYSADPPSVAVSIAEQSRSHPALVSGDCFGVHLLAEGQEHIADVFASRAGDKFGELAWRWEDAIPRLLDVRMFLACRTAAVFHHGDHSIVIGDVARVEGEPDDPPLVYWRRRLEWRLVSPARA